ncbi:3483_t:CDS:2 [Funneliformis geosporum]|uniref:3483_t:CDS:1 n=1 Tax=Funneliformis geosporum TaxID=1117311 RepID=A0A9W4SR87_9GLOM|nr:3483_t:CDS:2 [Funneliformis geosporum]
MDKKIEGPFNGAGGRFPNYLNKCGSCGEEIKGDKEYRRTYNEELFNKTGGRGGRTYYCVPCGERIIIKDCSLTISQLEQKLSHKNVAGTVEDYKKIKSVQQRIKKLGSFEDLIIKGEIEELKKNCQSLINEYISPKDRKIETESPKFLQSLKSYHIDKLNKKMLNNGISSFELNSLNYQSMLTVPDFLLTQEGIKDTYQKAEKDLEELLKKKGISIPQPNSSVNNPLNNTRNKSNSNNSHSQQSQLLSEIMNLEQNPNSNSQELDSKKQQLKALETKSKELIKSLPIETQIAILHKEIKVLENKSNKNHLEKTLLTDKKKELAELLSRKNNSHANNAKLSDKTGLYIGLGAIGEQEINEKNIHSIKISIEQYLDEAKARVKLIEERLQGRSEEKYEKHPILSLLEIKEGNPIYFSDVVKKKNVDKEEVCSNSTAHLKKHDIIAVRINSTLNYHVAVYRGGSIKTKEIAHIPDAKGSPAKFDTLDNFLENRNAERIILHRLIIPFKKPEEIENSINVAIDKKKYGKGKYNLITRNCEHFATLCVTGVKFSSQVKNLLDLNFKLNKEKINEKVLSEDNFIAQVEKASELDLSEFINLEELDCSSNQLTRLNISNCPNLEMLVCCGNLLTNLDLRNNSKLEMLNIGDNNFSEQDLSFLSHLVNLEVVVIGNKDEKKIQQGIYNHFVGSLEPLKDLIKLECLDIRNTDIDEGLEHLPENLEEFICLNKERQEAKGVVETDDYGIIKDTRKRIKNIKEDKNWKEFGDPFLDFTEETTQR